MMHRRLLALGVLGLLGCDASSVFPTGGEVDLGTSASDLLVRGGPDLTGLRDVCDPLDPRSPAPEVYATPEAGEAPYVDVLMRANRSIRVMIYLMGYGGIYDTLKAKAAAGVTVQAILDVGQSANQKYFTDLAAAGVQVKWSDPQFPYMHAKVFIVDEAEAMISTGNYSRNYSVLLERNFVAHDADPADVADLVALFDADWAGKAPDISCTRMLISPINARARILSLINSATSTITIESMQFADKDVRTAVQVRSMAGVKVRALLADPGWIDANADAALFLQALGIPVRHIPNLHTKALVVDGARGYLGSENFSYTSLSKNREVGLIVTEPSSVKPLVDTFEKDWAVSTSF